MMLEILSGDVQMKYIKMTAKRKQIKLKQFSYVAVLVLLYGCTTRTQTKMHHTVLNRSWKQYHTKQLCSHLTPISQTSEYDEQDILATAGEVKMNSIL